MTQLVRRSPRPLGLLLALLLASCGGGSDQAARPIATPAVNLSRTRIPLGAPVDVTYRFDVSPDAAPITEDYRVLVHFLDADEELMWTDDHESPIPTPTWRPGQTVEYTRTMFVPIYPYIGPGNVQIGLYSPETERRLLLTGQDEGQQSYTVATFELLPQSENVFLIYEDGWHPSEIASDNPMVEWQWTQKDAVIAFRNPQRDSRLFLELDGRPDHFTGPLTVTVTTGDTTLDEFVLESRDRILRRIPIGSAQLGEAEMSRVHILVDRTFVPTQLAGNTSPDDRELGVRVFHAFLEVQ